MAHGFQSHHFLNLISVIFCRENESILQLSHFHLQLPTHMISSYVSTCNTPSSINGFLCKSQLVFFLPCLFFLNDTNYILGQSVCWRATPANSSNFFNELYHLLRNFTQNNIICLSTSEVIYYSFSVSK